MWAPKNNNPAISAPPNLHFQIALRDDDSEEEFKAGTRWGRRRNPSKKQNHRPKQRLRIPSQAISSTSTSPIFFPKPEDDPSTDPSNDSGSSSDDPDEYHSGDESDEYKDVDLTQALLNYVTHRLKELIAERVIEGQFKKLFKESSNDIFECNMATQEEQQESRQQYAFVDGNFAELAQDLANHLNIGDDVKSIIEKDEKDQQDEVLKKLIIASASLHSVPEKEFTANYNLLIYLVLQSDHVGMFLPRVCDNLMKPVTSSPVHGPALALQALTTIFNLLQQENEHGYELRFNVLMAILRFIKLNSMYDNLKKALPNIKEWLKQWETDEEDQRKLFLEMAEVAYDAGDDEASYQHVLSALHTFDEEDVKSENAQQFALRALKTALLSPTHNDFQDLLAVPAIQALSDSHPLYFELLTIFAEKDLEDYKDFNDEHEGFVEKEHLDGDKLHRKIRLLTFASLAASTPNREIPYENIAKALQIPIEEVEMWTIDVIRAGLVEGKLSQQKKVFLVHQTFYRVFGEKQWREVGDRLDGWRTLVANVIANLRREQANAESHKKREAEELERRLANTGIGGGNHSGAGGGGRRGGGDRGNHSERAPRKERTEDDD
ncbi:PCI-domain-containing protein [Daldinia grandis]|nr:PCI-domain-containing protein [Daldinia grandis]